MAKVTVHAGICGFVGVINAQMNEDEMVEVDFKTTCPNFKKLEQETLEFDPYTCLFGKLGEDEITQLFKPLCPHITCPIPNAFLKAVEVAGGMALPKDVTMKIEK